MQLIDNDGDVFGVINIIDLLVVVVVVVGGLVVGGILLTGDDNPDKSTSNGIDDQRVPETRYATISLGVRSQSVAESIEVGSRVVTTGDGSTGTVTDIFRSPRGSNVELTVRLELNGFTTANTSDFRFNGTRLTTSDNLFLNELGISATVIAVDDRGDTLPVNETGVVLERTNLPEEKAGAIDVGDRFRTGGGTVAVVESVTVYPAERQDRRHVFVGVSLRTMSEMSRPTFAGTPVIANVEMVMRLADVSFTATIVRVGSTNLPGRTETRTVVVQARNLEPSVADAIGPGDIERNKNVTYAEVTRVDRRPARVVLTSESGEIFIREHPRLQTVNLTVQIRGRVHGDKFFFHGEPLREGKTIRLDLDTLRVSGTVRNVTAPNGSRFPSSNRWMTGV